MMEVRVEGSGGDVRRVCVGELTSGVKAVYQAPSPGSQVSVCGVVATFTERDINNYITYTTDR